MSFINIKKKNEVFMKKFICFICFFALTMCAFANGGIPWQNNGVLIKDHKIQLINDKDFKLQKEDLTDRKSVV